MGLVSPSWRKVLLGLVPIRAAQASFPHESLPRELTVPRSLLPNTKCGATRLAPVARRVDADHAEHQHAAPCCDWHLPRHGATPAAQGLDRNGEGRDGSAAAFEAQLGACDTAVVGELVAQRRPRPAL